MILSFFYKDSITIEEVELAYGTRFVGTTAGGKHKPEFLALSPNNKLKAT